MSISRAQLAAALVEYDNEDAPPSERKNHRQSALFAFTQPRSPPPPQLPSPVTHIPSRDSHRPPSHHARPSTSISHHDVEEEPEDIDVSRWGLPEHLISTAPAKSPELIQPMMASRASMPGIATRSAATPVPNPESSPLQSRARSIHLDYPDDSDTTARPTVDVRRRTISFDLDRNTESVRRRTHSNSEYLSGADAALAAAERALAMAEAPRARSVMGVLEMDMAEFGETSRVREPMMIPLPSSPTSVYTRPIPSMSRGRSFEMDRWRSFIGEMYDEPVDEEDISTPNPFALPAPPISQASRFDPKFAESAASPPFHPSHDRRSSTLSSVDPRRQSQPIASSSRDSSHPLQPMSPNSAVHPSRPTYADIPTPGEFGKPLIPPKYARRQPHPDRRSLLRPRTLIMPVPLQGTDYVPQAKVRAGFTLGEKPLPAGARSSILSMGGGGAASQGRGGVLPGQVGEIQQQGREFGRGLAQELQEEEEDARLRREEEEDARARAEAKKRDKMPGKLYGTSLMDQLEARKQYTKNKQRAFTGDSRPTMFARQSTLLPGSASAASLSPNQPHIPSPQPLTSPPGPSSQRLYPTSHASSSPDKKRHSVRAPLLQFDDADDPTAAATAAEGSRPGMPRSRSVFGVDELWEKEMAKLRIIQAEGQARKALAEAKEREEGEKEKKKGWLSRDKKGKGKAKELASGTPELGTPAQEDAAGMNIPAGSHEYGGYGGVSPVKNKVGDLPPTLRYSPEKASAPTPLPDIPTGRRAASRAGLDGWDSEDEEDDERRIGRQAKGKAKASQPLAKPQPESDSDSEDDVPLSRIIPTTSRTINTIPPTPTADSDSDEDVPLSRLAPRPPSTHSAPAIQLNSDVSGSLGLSVPALPPSVSPRPPTIPTVHHSPLLAAQPLGDDEDDDQPLGLRPGLSTRSNLAIAPAPAERTEAEKAEIEDDLPLGFKHAGAAQRQVSGGSQGGFGGPNMGMGQGHQSWGGMQGYPSYHPQQHQGSAWGAPPMGMPGYGMMGYQQGYHPQAYGPYGGMPQPLPISTSGLPFLPQPQHMGSPVIPSTMPPFNPAAAVQFPPTLGIAPGPGPGQNIDSWRKGVRAPSVAGTEPTR